MDRGDVEVRPITDDDVTAVAAFLHEQLNTGVAIAAWERIFTPPWQAQAPNRGFQLIAGSAIVGAYAAVYSDRDIDGEVRRFCNLAAFCVRKDYRAHSFRLLRAILAQQGFEFTDFSPSGNVVSLNQRLGFTVLDTTTRVAVNLPRLPRHGLAVTADPGVVASTLRGDDARVYRDHRDAPAARHIVATSGGEYCYLVVRKDRRKGLGIFASVLYAGGDAGLLRTAWPRIASHLLLRHGALATLAERRILGFMPALGYIMRRPRAKMFRSSNVSAETIDYLYSELALVQW